MFLFQNAIQHIKMKSLRHTILLLAGATSLALVPALPTDVGLGTTPAFAKKKYKKKRTQKQSRKPDSPLLVVVSIGSQRISVFDRNGQIAQSRISSGTRYNPTPTGVFSILQKRRRHYSNLYAGAAMPNMQRITWSGVALHAGHLPGYPASHGCIRLYYSFSKWLFGVTEMGTRVIVSRSNPVPKKISHPILLKPLPPEYAVKLQSASNETMESQDTSGDVTNAIFVSPANAAETPAPLNPDHVRTREYVAAERERELVKLENALEDAKQNQASATLELKEANQALKVAIKELQTAQNESKQLQQIIRTSDRAKRKLNSQLQNLLRNTESLGDPKALEFTLQKEERLEAELLKHESEREMARKESQDLKKVTKRFQANVDAATNTRDQIKRRYTQISKQLTSAHLALNQALAAAKRRDKPITVLISRKKKMLFVRQGYDDVLRVAVNIKNPEMPIGTHVFAALAYQNNETEFEWHAITAARSDVTRRRSRDRRRRSRRRRHKEVEPRPVRQTRFSQTPKNALDRIEIPQEVAERLAEHVKPGSALIISDEGLSNETGKYTDIIVSTR